MEATMLFSKRLRITLAALFGIAAFTAGASAFEGRYGSSNAGTRIAAITRGNQGVYKVLLTVTSGQCTGELEAYGEVEGGNLVAEVAAQDDPCKVTISRRGGGIAVREQRCLNWHGAGCDFNGQLQPR
jgi:hypothetical protein